jgi:DNA polymerase-1
MSHAYQNGEDLHRLTAKNHNILLSVREASLFRQKFFEAYAGLKAYQTQIRRQWQQGMRVSRTIDGRRRLWSKQRKPILNELLNHPIQGANATILKRALALLGRYLTRTKAKLIAVIHDEILLGGRIERSRR